MPERTTREDLIGEVKQDTNLTRKDAEDIVDAVFHDLIETLRQGERIELRGFGVFTVKSRKRGVVARSSRTDEEVCIPPGATIHFKPMEELSSSNLSDQTQTMADDENIEEIIQQCIQEVDKIRAIARRDREEIEILKIETREILGRF